MLTGLLILYFIIGLIAAGLLKLFYPPIEEPDYMLTALAFFFWPAFLFVAALWAIGRLICFIIDMRG